MSVIVERIHILHNYLVVGGAVQALHSNEVLAVVAVLAVVRKDQHLLPFILRCQGRDLIRRPSTHRRIRRQHCNQVLVIFQSNHV